MANGRDDIAAPAGPDNGAGSTSTESKEFNWGAPLALAGTLVVGVFAATGITGDATARVVRNLPIQTSFAIGLVIAAVAAATYRRAPTNVDKACIVLAAFGLVGLVVLSAMSLNDREMPEVSLAVAAGEPEGTHDLTITTSGHGLRSNEKMLVQVIGVTEEYQSHERSSDLCVRSFNLAERDPAVAPHVRLLLWNESGPDSSGKAHAEATMPVGAEYHQVCAYVALRARGQAVSPYTWALWHSPE